MRLPLAIPPGLRRDGTEGQSSGRWMRSSLVRGYGADVGPILGWRKRSSDVDPAITGKARAILAWSTEGAERRLAIGTHTGLFVQNAGGQNFDVTPASFVAGEPDATVNTGFGGGPFGLGAYGTPRLDTGSPAPASVWSLDNWGIYLVGCCASDGRLVEWQNDTSAPAAAIANAPTGCVAVLTTQDRFTVGLGASGNPRLVAWSDRGDNTIWTPSTTNLAGDMELDSQGAIVCAVELRSLSLILTDVDAHAMVYAGLPSVYVFNRLGEACGVVSVGCVATTGDFAMWWSKSGFKRFDGALSNVQCPLDNLFSGANASQLSKVSAWHNAERNEFWWLYPSSASTENDRYVTFNYVTGEWWRGAMARLSGAGQGVFTYPLLMGDDGYVYEHEVGSNYDGATPYAQSGPVALGDGEFVMRVTGIVPDTVGVATVGFATRDYPRSPPVTVAQADLADGRTDLRFTARQVELNVEFTTSDGRFGRCVLEVERGGRR